VGSSHLRPASPPRRCRHILHIGRPCLHRHVSGCRQQPRRGVLHYIEIHHRELTTRDGASRHLTLTSPATSAPMDSSPSASLPELARAPDHRDRGGRQRGSVRGRKVWAALAVSGCVLMVRWLASRRERDLAGKGRSEWRGRLPVRAGPGPSSGAKAPGRVFPTTGSQAPSPRVRAASAASCKRSESPDPNDGSACATERTERPAAPGSPRTGAAITGARALRRSLGPSGGGQPWARISSSPSPLGVPAHADDAPGDGALVHMAPGGTALA
jgi:hypothetical protein